MAKLVISSTFFSFGKLFLCNITSVMIRLLFVSLSYCLPWLYFILIFIFLFLFDFLGCSWIPCGDVDGGRGDGQSTRICGGLVCPFVSLSPEQAVLKPFLLMLSQKLRNYFN